MSARKTTKKPKKLAYFNRELSWLAFNRRVLEQATWETYPLLERLRFLCFVCSNLDEFFEIRVAGLMQQVKSGVIEVGMDGLGPRELIRRILDISTTLVHDKYVAWHDHLVPALAKEGIFFKEVSELNRRELKWVGEFFTEGIYPVLTPMGIDPSHPFPQLTNKSLNILLWLSESGDRSGERRLAVVPVPRILPRIIRLEASSKETYVYLADIIKSQAKALFPGYRIHGAWAFRITRNSDLYIDEEEVENLLQKIEEELHKLMRGDAVRLEIEEGVPEELLSDLLGRVDLSPEYVFRVRGPVNLLRLMPVCDLIEREELKFESFRPYHPRRLAPDQLFEILSREDILLHHPYDSFQPVIDFVEAAARDPQVFAIKQTLYRTSGDSPIIEALKLASRNGKQVTALVELKARFDEANNIEWARQLEEVGVHVVYGLVGLKTHCKCSMVVRREQNGFKRYAHLGTGNYNPKTARLYTDVSYLTAKSALTQEVADLFNTLTGFARSPKFNKLLVAPFTLHRTMQRLIKKETSNARAGKPARIFAKVNSLIDKETIDNLYEASGAGVKIDLVVRGICGLVPGVKGMSENIRVRSLLGRYLEHSRIFYFHNGGKEPKVYLGSADWMQRNFFRRIESVFPVESPDLRKRVIEEIIPPFFKDTACARQLRSNGSYAAVRGQEGGYSAQAWFMRLAEQQTLEEEDLEEKE